MLSAIVSTAPTASADPELLKHRPRIGEYQPVRGDGFLAWQQNSRRQPGHYDVFAQPIDGGAKVRVNRGRANGALGDIAGDVLVYQEFRRRRSDLRFFDLDTNRRSSPPPGVNTRHWEYWPSMEGDLLLFGRLYGNHTRRIILFDLSTRSATRLDRIRGARAQLDPGQISGDYAVWDRCVTPDTCEVVRYEISTGSSEVVSNATKVAKASSVAPDGTVYFVRSRGGCGTRPRLVRQPLTGPDQVLTPLPNGDDVGSTHVYVDAEGGVTVLYDVHDCDAAAQSDAWQIVEGRAPQLTVSVEGDGRGRVTSSPSGINCGADCSETYDRGTGVTLTATPEGDSAFAGWGGACSGSSTSCTVTMDRARSVTATFTTKPVLTVNKTGSGSGTVSSSPGGITCGSDCSEPYAEGTTVTLTADPASGSTFEGWGGACSGTGACQVTMNSSRTVTATFDAVPQHTLTVDVTGNGSVTGPGGIDCPDSSCTAQFNDGAAVSLTATPDDPLSTTTWGGDCTGTVGDTCDLTMNADRDASVVFA